MDCAALNQQTGKKLLWVGYDKISEYTYLVFEGGQVISVDNASAVGLQAVEKYVEENIDGANSVKALQTILKEIKDVSKSAPVAAVETGAVEAQSGVGGDTPATTS